MCIFCGRSCSVRLDCRCSLASLPFVFSLPASSGRRRGRRLHGRCLGGLGSLRQPCARQLCLLQLVSLASVDLCAAWSFRRRNSRDPRPARGSSVRSREAGCGVQARWRARDWRSCVEQPAQRRLRLAALVPIGQASPALHARCAESVCYPNMQGLLNPKELPEQKASLDRGCGCGLAQIRPTRATRYPLPAPE